MRYLTLLALVAFFTVSCCCKKKTASTTEHPKEMLATDENITPLDSSMAIATGKVSHKYKPNCPAVVVFTNENNETVTLIPKDNLGSLDKDGLEIIFNYRLLRMPNPEGCVVGKMAEIRNARRK